VSKDVARSFRQREGAAIGQLHSCSIGASELQDFRIVERSPNLVFRRRDALAVLHLHD
jgi:hypothetical protein